MNPPSGRYVVVNEREHCVVWRRILSEFRSSFKLFLEVEFSRAAGDVYLLAYDCGFSEGMRGGASVVSVGIRKGLVDAISLSADKPLPDLVDMAIALGRKHAESMLKIHQN